MTLTFCKFRLTFSPSQVIRCHKDLAFTKIYIINLDLACALRLICSLQDLASKPKVK